MIKRLKKSCLYSKLKDNIAWIKYLFKRVIQHNKFKKVPIEMPVWVKLEEIKVIINDSVLHELRLKEKFGIYLDGDWDLHVGDIEQYDFIRSYKMRFNEGKDWGETPLYGRVLQQINAGLNKFGCSNEQEWIKRLKKDELLYEEIKYNGYKLQSEISNGKPWDEIRVGISRTNEVIFLDGRHRLSIAKVLQLNKVPVYISVIHPKANITEWEL